MSQSYVLKVQKTLEDNRTVYRVLLILVWHFIKEFSMGISICIRNQRFIDLTEINFIDYMSFCFNEEQTVHFSFFSNEGWIVNH